MTAKQVSAGREGYRGHGRMISALVLALIVMVLSSASGGRGPLKQPNKLLILSTSDVKGKTGPCG